MNAPHETEHGDPAIVTEPVGCPTETAVLKREWRRITKELAAAIARAETWKVALNRAFWVFESQANTEEQIGGAEFWQAEAGKIAHALATPSPAPVAGTESQLWERLPMYLIEKYEGEQLTEELIQQATAELARELAVTPVAVGEKDSAGPTPRTDADWNEAAGFKDSTRALVMRNRAMKLERENMKLRDALLLYREAYEPDGHIAPHDCFSTCPKTGPSIGNKIYDHVACPGCAAKKAADRALTPPVAVEGGEG